MLITCRTMLASSLIGLFLTIATTSSGQGLQQAHPIPQPPSSGPGRIISRPFAHPTRQIAIESPPVVSDARGTRRSGQPFHPAADAWKKIIRLIRQNAKLEAAVEKTEAVAKAELGALEEIAKAKLDAFEEIAETKLHALETIAKAKLRAAEERQATLKEQNERLQARVKELEQELNDAEQEMRERNVHSGHMERQMLQQTELLDELQRQLQQTRDQPSAREEALQRENAPRRRGINRERAVPPGFDRRRD